MDYGLGSKAGLNHCVRLVGGKIWEAEGAAGGAEEGVWRHRHDRR